MIYCISILILTINLSFVFYIFFIKKANLILAFHLTEFFVLYNLLTVLNIFTQMTRYELSIYIGMLSYSIIYSIIFLFLWMVLSNHLPKNYKILSCLKNINLNIISYTVSSWVFFKAYLFIKYGYRSLRIFQLFIYRGESEALAYWEYVTSGLLTYMAIGCFFVFMVHVLIEPARTLKLRNILPLSFFALFYILLGEASVGARRFILASIIFSVLTYVLEKNYNIKQFIKPKYFTTLLLICLIPFIFSFYYQHIRTNFYNSDISALLASDSLSNRLKGMVMYLTPSMVEEVTQAEQITQLRKGVFDLLYSVVEKQWDVGKKGYGVITLSTLDNIVPRAFNSEKQYKSADELTVNIIGISPGEFDYTELDLPTSVMSIFEADFGLIGLLFAPILYFVFIVFYILQFVKYNDKNQVISLAALGLLLVTASNIEVQIDTFFSNLRDYILLIIILTILSFLKLSIFEIFNQKKVAK